MVHPKLIGHYILMSSLHSWIYAVVIHKTPIMDLNDYANNLKPKKQQECLQHRDLFTSKDTCVFDNQGESLSSFSCIFVVFVNTHDKNVENRDGWTNSSKTFPTNYTNTRCHAAKNRVWQDMYYCCILCTLSVILDLIWIWLNTGPDRLFYRIPNESTFTTKRYWENGGSVSVMVYVYCDCMESQILE